MHGACLSQTSCSVDSRSWLQCTKPCQTTVCTWKALSSNPTWSLLDTAVPPSTAQKRLLWLLSLPCAALFPLQCQVNQNLEPGFCICGRRIKFSDPCRSGFSFGWSEWGGGLCPPQCHQQLPSGQTLDPDLLIWSSPAGVRTEGLERS